MLWPAFHFHSVLLIFVNLWPISTLCVADMVHAVADNDNDKRLGLTAKTDQPDIGLWLISSFPYSTCASHVE